MKQSLMMDYKLCKDKYIGGFHWSNVIYVSSSMLNEIASKTVLEEEDIDR